MNYELSKTLPEAMLKAKKKPDPKADVKAYEIRFTVKFPPGPHGADPEGTTLRAKSLLARLAEAFPGADVEAVRLPSEVVVNQILEGNAGGLSQDRAAAVNGTSADYLIRTAI
jgi:hypothetical protein